MSDSGSPSREYGVRGWLGIVTPQANPTVEAEMARLLPEQVLPLTTRATSNAEDPRQRLIDYFDRLSQSLLSFDTLPLDAAGFACTGSSYLVGQGAESEAVQRLERQFQYPVVTATTAITEELRLRDINRLYIVAPYPAWLCEAATAFWTEAGFEVVGLHRMDLGTSDTRAIYAIRSHQVLATLEGLDLPDADLILMSGTGMPTLTAIKERPGPLPMLSSNLCLAGALLRRLGLWSPAKPLDLVELFKRDRTSFAAE